MARRLSGPLGPAIRNETLPADRNTR
jgi:hypothetical protein